MRNRKNHVHYDVNTTTNKSDEDRFTRALIKKKEIEEQKKREKEKKQKQEEDESKKIPDSVKIKLIKLNYDDNISVFNKLLTYTPDLIRFCYMILYLYYYFLLKLVY